MAQDTQLCLFGILRSRALKKNTKNIFEIKNFLNKELSEELIFGMKKMNIECYYHGKNPCDFSGPSAPIKMSTRNREYFLELSTECLNRFQLENKEIKNESKYFLLLNEILQKTRLEIEKIFNNSVSPLKLAFHRYNKYSQQKPHVDEYPYAAILYLTDDYEGGELYFPDQKISFKPNSCSLYIFKGKKNLHGVSEVFSGERYTVVTFWVGERETLGEREKGKHEQ